jgi:hypothetical protein
MIEGNVHLGMTQTFVKCFSCSNSFKFTVFIETPSKSFNEWTFLKVCELYGLSDDPNPSIDVYPVFREDVSTQKMRNTKKRCVNFLTNWRLVLQRLLLTYPMKPPKASIRILISSLQLVRLKIK